jgi:2-polyprenyl-3-methyl-5-hydroxy-6-metoxy-1,4-benzoquinol methylase
MTVKDFGTCWCGQNANTVTLNTDDYVIVKCSSCGTGRTLPTPYEDYNETDEYSKAEFDEEYNKNESEWMGFARFTLKQWQDLDKNLSGKTFLDLGFGGGHTLKAALERSAVPYGLELNPNRIAYAKQHFGIDNVAVGLLGDEPADWPKQYDAINLAHVMEHVPDPLALLKQVKEYLTTEGKVIISVPNYGSVLARYAAEGWRGLQVHQHIWQYSPKAMENMAQKAGMKVYSVKAHPLGTYVTTQGKIKYYDTEGSFARDAGWHRKHVYLSNKVFQKVPVVSRTVVKTLHKIGHGDQVFLVAGRS